MTPMATVNGRLLISTTDGANLGSVKGIYVDREVRRGVAVFLGKTGIISRKEHLIDLKHVRLFGVDAWLVDGSNVDVVREEFDGGENLVLAESLYGREIQTDGGTRIGTVEDILVDSRFAVLGFSLAKTFIQGPVAEKMAIARAAVTSFGDKLNPMITSLEQAEKLDIKGD